MNDDIKKDAPMRIRLCLQECYSMHCSWEHIFTNSQQLNSSMDYGIKLS